MVSNEQIVSALAQTALTDDPEIMVLREAAADLIPLQAGGPIFRSVVHECCEKATIQQDRANAMERLLREIAEDELRVHISVRAEIDQALAYINDADRT